MSPEISPSLFLETVNSYQRSAVIKAAIQLKVFTHINDGGSAKELASRCGTSVRGMRVLCDYLTVIGFLSKESNYYQTTPESAVFLSRKSPAYVGDAIDFLLSPALLAGFDDVASAVRKGGTILNAEGMVFPENPIWKSFARTMAPLMEEPAKLVSELINADPPQRLRVLDIAAGHGLFGINLAKSNPKAEVTAVDWPDVLEIAKDNALAAGISDRYFTINGSAFEVDYGYDYDLVLLVNFLHHFDISTCESLLKKVYAALAQNGRVITFDYIPDDDRISPPEAALFSMLMLCTTPNGDAHTFSQLKHLFSRTGFSSSVLYDLPSDSGRIVISQR